MAEVAVGSVDTCYLSQQQRRIAAYWSNGHTPASSGAIASLDCKSPVANGNCDRDAADLHYRLDSGNPD